MQLHIQGTTNSDLIFKEFFFSRFQISKAVFFFYKNVFRLSDKLFLSYFFHIVILLNVVKMLSSNLHQSNSNRSMLVCQSMGFWVEACQPGTFGHDHLLWSQNFISNVSIIINLISVLASCRGELTL